MDLIERLGKHWLVGAFTLAATCVGTTWYVANEILVKPRDYTIKQLENLKNDLAKQNETLTKKLALCNPINVGPVIPKAQGAKKVFLFEQLPKEGQIIIPKGLYFQIKTNMQGNARKFKQQDTIDDIIKFSSEVAKDRANLYEKNTEDFPTVIWENSDEQYEKDDIKTLREYPKNNTIKNITKSTPHEE